MKKTPKFWFIIFTIILFSFGIYSFYKTMFREYHPVILNQPKIEYTDFAENQKINSTLINSTFTDEYLIFSLKDLINYKLVKLNDPKKILPVPLLAYFTNDGRIVTAISLSENCKSTDFYLEGNEIHCSNCPSYWNKESLEAYACCPNYYPEVIPSILEKDEVKISYEILKKWKPRQ